jgi:PAS domain S-box-containing protein
VVSHLSVTRSFGRIATRPVVLLALLLALAAAAGSALVWLTAERSRAESHRQAMLRTEQRALQLADALTGQVQALLGGIDIALLQLRREWQAGRPDFDTLASSFVRAMPDGAVSHVTVVDAQGDTVYNSLGTSERVNVADREHFLVQARSAEDRLHVGKAVQSRLARNTWTAIVNRPMQREGRFAGTMNVSVPTAFFAARLASLALDDKDIVGLVHDDGSFLARSRDHDLAMAHKLPPDRPFLVDRQADRGLFRVAGEVDGVARIYAWRRLPGQGLVVVVGLAEDTALAPLSAGRERERLVSAALLTVLLAAAAAIGALLWQAGRQQAALMRGERRYRALVDSSPDAIFLVRDGRFSYLNPSALRLFGAADAGQMLGRSVLDHIHPDFHDSVRQRRDVLHRTLQAVPAMEERYVRLDGSEVDVEVSAAPYADESGQSSQVVARDITDRRRAARELQQLANDLERRVEERTAALTTARDEAERANRAKSDFLSRMSHELRTPLNAVLGFGQLLEREMPDDGARGKVRHILQAGQHLLDLINDVLDLARVEAGHLTVSVEPVTLQPLIADCLDLVRPPAQARGLMVSAPRSGDVRRALADRTRLKQVLLNLLSNAVKYNREGGQLAVRLEDDTTHWRLCVDDTGPGLDAEQRARLFVPFERLDADRSAIEGTGIGLALSRRLVELMHGTIGVDSEPGRGSCFWVRLPKAAEATARAARAAAPVPAAADAAIEPGEPKLELLCIEDNPVNLAVVQHMVALRPRWRLLDAATPARGIELARQRQPRLILLDIHLPEMDGWSVMRVLREDPATRGIQVVAVSAHAMPADLARGRAAGFADYLTKPLDLRLLLQLLDDHAV